MSTVNEQPTTVRAILPSISLWQKRFFIVMTILGWLVLVVAIIWGIGKIITPIVLIGFSALIAYLIYPLVRFFQRHMPRVLAILLSILLMLAVIGAVLYFVVVAAVQQFALQHLRPDDLSAAGRDPLRLFHGGWSSYCLLVASQNTLEVPPWHQHVSG